MTAINDYFPWQVKVVTLPLINPKMFQYLNPVIVKSFNFIFKPHYFDKLFELFLHK